MTKTKDTNQKANNQKDTNHKANKLVVVLLIFAIVISVISLIATLSIDAEDLENSGSQQTEDSNSGQVRFEVLSRDSQEVNNEAI